MLRKVAWGIALAAGVANGAETARVEKLIIDRTNQFRHEQGLPAVERDRVLDRAARDFAEYMARHDNYGHEADGRKPSERAKSHGYDYCMVSENISYQYHSADFATGELAERYVESWKASPGHRKNMREPNVVDTGVAVARSPKTGRYYAVQMFGRPKSRGVEFRISNATHDPIRYHVGGEAFALTPGAGRIHELCVPATLSIEGGRGEPVKLARGDRFVVVSEASRPALRRDR